MIDKILRIVNTIRVNKGASPVSEIGNKTSLRSDLGFDSLDLAEFTVRIERETGIDVFDNGLVDTIAEVLEKISII